MPSALPVRLLIAKINRHPRLEPVGVDRIGAMAVTYNYFAAAWYNAAAVPGDLGDAVIDGDAGYSDQPLVFARLVSPRSGDKIVWFLPTGAGGPLS